jgi:hypothetical protein
MMANNNNVRIILAIFFLWPSLADSRVKCGIYGDSYDDTPNNGCEKRRQDLEAPSYYKEENTQLNNNFNYLSGQRLWFLVHRSEGFAASKCSQFSFALQNPQALMTTSSTGNVFVFETQAGKSR